MLRRLFLLAAVLWLAPFAQAQKPTDPEEIRKEIARLKQRLAELEAELVRVEKPKIEKLNLGSLQDGARVGTFGAEGVSFLVYVDEVLGPKEFVARVRQSATSDLFVVISSFPTKDLVDGALLDTGSKLWRVTGTRKHGARTLYAVEPYSAPKK